jgi:WD40 repeat protein
MPARSFAVLSFRTGDGPVHAAAFTAGGRQLVIDQVIPGREADRARELVWWDLASAAVVRRFPLLDMMRDPAGPLADHPQPYPDWPPIDVSFCPHTDRVVIAWPWGSVEDPVCVYDLAANTVECLWFPTRNHLFRVAFAPDGRRIALATEHQKVDEYQLAAWPAEEGEVPQFRLESAWERCRWCWLPWVENPQKGERPELAFDGRFAACAWPPLAGVFVWDTEAAPDGPERLRNADPGFPAARLAFAAGSPLLAVGGDRLAVWDIRACDWVANDAVSSAVTALAFDPPAGRLAVGTRDGGVELRDGPGWRGVRRLAWDGGAVTAVAFAPDGLTLAAGGENGRVVVWDVDD